MKNLFAVLLVSFACSLAAQAQSICYGSWWTTIPEPGERKEGGEILISFDDIGNVAGIGSFTLQLQNKMTILTWSHLWQKSPTTTARQRVKWSILQEPGGARISGYYNPVTGQVTGTFRTGGTVGKLQGLYQPVWNFDPSFFNPLNPAPQLK